MPVGDAIPLAEGAPLRLYLAADPLTAVQGRVRYMAYDVARPDGSYAYRVRASLDQAQGPRIGLEGHRQAAGASACRWLLDPAQALGGHPPVRGAMTPATPLPLRDELDLLPAPPCRTPAQLTLHDPVRNLFFQIDWASFEILQRWRPLARRDRAAHPGRDHAARRTGRCRGHAPLPGAARAAVQPGRADRAELAEQRQRRRAGWSQWLLHNYLFFRVPLLRRTAG